MIGLRRMLGDSRVRTRLGVAAGVLGAVSVLAVGTVPAASAQAPTPLQSVTSSTGGYAWTWGGGPEERRELGDGRLITFTAFFSHPEGAVTGSPPGAGLDLREPVGMLELGAETPFGEPGTRAQTWDLCHAAANVTSYDTGHAVPVANHWGQNYYDFAWTGVWFDIECDAGLGFDFFRVDFGADAPSSPANRFDPTGAGVAVEEQEYKPLFLGVDPIVAPGASVDRGGSPVAHAFRTHDWAAPGAIARLAAEPKVHQNTGITLCGYQGGEPAQCWRGGGGTVVPDTWGMTNTLHPRP